MAMANLHQIVLFLTVVVVGIAVCAPTPGGSKREKYIIHVPVKYHTIHHVKVQKIPVYVKKHVHHHKYEDEHHHHHEKPHSEELDDHYGYDRYDDLGSNSNGGSYEAYDGSEEYER